MQIKNIINNATSVKNSLRNTFNQNKNLKQQIQNTSTTTVPQQSTALTTAQNSLQSLGSIISSGTSQRFENCFKYIIDVEGKYSNDKHDSGGETSWGIIATEARQHGYKGAMNVMPQSFAKQIYLKKYFLGFNIDKLKSDAIAYKMFDWCVNSGKAPMKIKEALKKAYGANVQGLSAGNSITANDINIINNIVKTKNDETNVVKVIETAQRNYYRSLPKYVHFGKGWENRVTKNIGFISSTTGLNLNPNTLNAQKQIKKQGKVNT